jgi:hypothetical protein
MTDGLPLDSPLNGDFQIDSFFDITYEIGGSLGGEVETGQARATLQVNGTGTLAGFNRVIVLPVDINIHTAPRTEGADHQSFDTEMVAMVGQLFGDPDFDLLRISAGSQFGMPSPGQTTLTRLGDGNFHVDSFFDIDYQIEFQGAPGSVLEGLGGTTHGQLRLSQGFGRNHLYADQFGLDHDALGAACLDDSSGRLVVSNIGSSGKDGVRIDLGAAEGFAAEVDFGPLGSLPEGMHLSLSGNPQFPTAGLDGSPGFTIHVAEADGLANIAFNQTIFGQVPIAVEYRGLLAGELIELVSIDGPIQPVLARLGSSGLDGVTVAVDCAAECDVVFEFASPVPTEFSLPGGPFLLDHVQLCVKLPEGPLPLGHVDVLASGLGQIEIIDEAVSMFCNDHRAVGAAHLNANGDHLTISNIGSSGLDGVAVDLDDVTDCNICRCLPGWTLDFGQAGQLPSGSNIHLQAVLPILEDIDECVWCIDIEGSSSGGALLGADFTLLDPVSLTVELQLAGETVDTLFNVTGQPLSPLVISNIGSSGKDGVSVDVGRSGVDMFWDIAWPLPGLANFPGEPEVVADSIRITAHEVDNDCDGAVASIPAAPPAPRYEIIVENVPTLTIFDERIHEPCDGDIDGDGEVNVVDLVRLILAWGTNDPAVDANGDGVVNVTDMIDLIVNWGTCD